MKPGVSLSRWVPMTDTEIDDSGMGPQDPTDPAAFQHPDPTLCPECEGVGSLPSGEVCPVCEGSGKAVGRTGGG
jgi:hypothetical protein